MTDEQTTEAGFEEDEVDEFQEPELGDDIDAELDGDLEEGDLEDIADDELGDDDDDALVDDEFAVTAEPAPEAEEEAVEERRPRAKAAGDEKEEEDEEELDPDDVEADLDTILKDRLEAYDEAGEDEEEEEVIAGVAEEGDLPQKREGEFPCPSCFLLVSAKQVGRTGYCPHCGDPISIPATLR
jgi:hypothetical protein